RTNPRRLRRPSQPLEERLHIQVHTAHYSEKLALTAALSRSVRNHARAAGGPPSSVIRRPPSVGLARGRCAQQGHWLLRDFNGDGAARGSAEGKIAARYAGANSIIAPRPPCSRSRVPGNGSRNRIAFGGAATLTRQVSINGTDSCFRHLENASC